jgi:phosphatidylserine/phosphatidylglycerophosphate/cardiolipin synthase-like enzyme
MQLFPTRHRRHTLLVLLVALLAALTQLTCGTDAPDATSDDDRVFIDDGKSDALEATRRYEVLLTQPFCDMCTEADKNQLQQDSQLVARIIELIDGARTSIDVAQFTFSSRPIEEALYRAKARGVRVRLAIDAGQNREGSLARRMAANGVDVRFVAAGEIGDQQRSGLLHSKFMVVDDNVLLSGSNNWSSTGTTINEENTIVMTSVKGDPLVEAFQCHFDAAWALNHAASGDCSTATARFSPSGAGRTLIRDGLRGAQRSVDVLMHHLLFDDLIRELAIAAERGVRVRIILNAADRNSYDSRNWQRLLAAGAEVRYKRNNDAAFQLMHHKLAIVDEAVLLHGSGNWSGSAFFNNYEFYVRYTHDDVVPPFNNLFTRLWQWSLSAETLDAGGTAAAQHFREHQVFFGNLHAHYEGRDDDGRLLDDGELLRIDQATGQTYSVAHELEGRHVARYAWEYGRDKGRLDFLALTPHVVDENPLDPPTNANMTVEAFEELVKLARAITAESSGTYVALPAVEWNTNTSGNHVNIFGTDVLCKVERDRFDHLYEDFLPGRVAHGERPMLQFNHPRTFSQHEDNLRGTWDQVFDVNLLDITSAAQRHQKFNDYGLDDYSPLREVRSSWLLGEALPDREIVRQTLFNIADVTAPYVRMMEVTIGRGNDIGHEQSQNPSWTERDGEPWRYTRVETDWHYYLLHGFRMAPTANHDNHYANWGTGHSSRTAVIAPSLTERALLDAIDQRLVYASEDENLAIALYADERIPMGGELITTADRITLHLRLEDPDYDGPYEIHVLKGTIGGESVKVVKHVPNVPEATWLDLTVPIPHTGEHFVYVEVHEIDARRKAWTAPIWVSRP